MNQYFTAQSIHCGSHIDIDGKVFMNEQNVEKSRIVTIGEDGLIYIGDIEDKKQQRQDLKIQEDAKTSIALHPNGTKCLIGIGKHIYLRDLNTQENTQILETLGDVQNVCFSKTGKFISAATEQQKCLVIDTSTKKNMKCRPGHLSKVIYSFFSPDEKYVVSIGEDKNLLVYQLSSEQQPQEMARLSICNDQQINMQKLKGSFHPNKQIIACPGAKQVQFIQLINNRWIVQKCTTIKHEKVLTITQFLNSHSLATVCSTDFLIWSYPKKQKLVIVENITFDKIIPLGFKLFAVSKQNAMIYQYTKSIPVEQPMDIQEHQQQNSQISFQNDEDNSMAEKEDEENEGSQQGQSQIVEQPIYENKKSKADRIVTVFPQQPLSTATNLFDGSRFLLTNLYGNVIQKRETEEDITIQLQLYSKSVNKVILFRNRDMRYFALNSMGIVFANQTQFGFRNSQIGMWQKKWKDIRGVALGNFWLAVINDASIRIYDLVGNFIRSYDFDRQFVAADAYQNLLAVVYHQSVPVWGSQCLSMQLYAIDDFPLTMQKRHVPIKRQSTLRWFGFSKQGMIITQDSHNSLKAFSLETNQWTSVLLTDIPSSRKIWIVGQQNYEVKCWRTTQMEPQPIVSPRLSQKNSQLYICYSVQQQVDQISRLLWKRFCIDHENARQKYWGRYKSSRQQKNPHYEISKTILSLSQRIEANANIDDKFTDIIKQHLKNEEFQKALFMAKSYIRTLSVGRTLIELFDQFKRHYAIQLQYFFDEKQREQQFQAIQQLKLNRIREQAQRKIKPKSEDPMKQAFKNRVMGKKFPSLGLSQISESISQNQNIVPKPNIIQQQVPLQEEPFENPFLKKKTDSVDRFEKNIQQQVSKHGIKKKIQNKTAIRAQRRQMND